MQMVLILFLGKVFSELDLEDLARYENLKVLIFQGDASTNLSSLESLNLEELTLGRTNFTLDFSKFPKLQRLAIDWRSGVFKKMKIYRI